MRAILDGDVIVYEVGFGAETMARGIDGPEALPPWDMVAALLESRINEILFKCEGDSYSLYLTEGKTFRDDVAVTRPYKGTRKDNKPWHYKNIREHMKNILGAKIIHNIEADDAMALDHLHSNDETILASRDKDLRQIPGPFYSWELGHQPSFGPEVIDDLGWLELNKSKLNGTGYKFFCAQVLMGDITDNIPGLPGCGPVTTYNLLHDCEEKHDMAGIVETAYLGQDEDYLLEQGRLCWITRRLNPNGTPVLWEIGMTE